MKEKERNTFPPDAQADGALYIVGLTPGTEAAFDRAYACERIKREFEHMDGLLQLVVLLHFYDDTREEQIARLLHSTRDAVNRLLMRAHAAFEQAILVSGAAPSYRDMPQLIFEALDELICCSTAPPESVARVRKLLAGCA